MSRILLSSDWHLSERPPSSCTDSYCDDLFDLLRQARGVAVDRDAAAFVGAGDIFHCKAANRVPYRLVHRLSGFIDALPRHLRAFLLYGNHDIANDRGESVMETQPLGMVYRAGASELSGPVGYQMYGVPWLQGYGPDPDQADAAVTAALERYRKLTHPGLVVTHAPLYPPGKELAYEHYPAERWAHAMGHQGWCFYGHVHEPHGVYQVDGVTFCNNGALSRGSLHEYNLTRQVGVTLWDSRNGFEFVPLDAKPAEEVFRLTEKQQATDVQGRLDDFLAGVGEARLEVMSVETVIEHIRSLGLGKAAEDLAAELLMEAQHG